MPRKKATSAPTLRDVCRVLDTLAPPHLAQSWDNVGLLAGDEKAPIRRIMLCIDMMPAVVTEAIRWRCDLVLAYHPPIFRPITRLVAPSDRMEAQVLRCLTRGIAIYSPHTALDSAIGGTNDVLATLCGAVDTVPIEPTSDDPTLGIGRVGALQRPVPLQTLARKLKRRANAGCVSVVGSPKQQIRRVIVGVGAAGSLPFSLDLGKHDAIVTGEIRHHDALRIVRIGCAAIALSHWSSERPALQSLAERLGRELDTVTVRLSQSDSEPFVRV